MNLDNFLQILPRIALNDFDDQRFVTMRLMTKGMTSPRIAKILYYATQTLDRKNECYCELGIWTGYSLAAAGLDGIEFLVGIEPFTPEFSTNLFIEHLQQGLAQTLSHFDTNAWIIQKDFRLVEWKKDLPETQKHRTIGALFIDANHTYEDVMDGFKWAEPLLSKQAIIVLDDIQVPGVEKALWEWIDTHDKYKLEVFVRGAPGTDQYTHNGFAVVSYTK